MSLKEHPVEEHPVEKHPVEERAIAIIAEQLGVAANKVVPAAHFREDLDADSLDLVELMMAFEEEFGGDISDEDAQKVQTVGEVIELLKRLAPR